jgi:hypothetical protein
MRSLGLARRGEDPVRVGFDRLECDEAFLAAIDHLAGCQLTHGDCGLWKSLPARRARTPGPLRTCQAEGADQGQIHHLFTLAAASAR